MKRIFIAHKIVPEAGFERILASVKSELADEKIKWSSPENIHITLLFIGDTKEESVERIDSVLNKICKGYGCFDLVIRGLGVFRNIADPRIIWAGVDESSQLTKLNKLITGSLRVTGINFEDRPYNAHITLGRIKLFEDKSKLKLLTDRYRQTEIQKLKVSEVILYESILKPEGPVYKPLGIYKL
jgi:2'-5' RNA ligase